MQKDEILERLVFSEAVVEVYAKAESNRTEPSCDHWTRPVLLERATYLRKLARFGEGFATESIREFPGYRMLLMVLLRSGDAVMHEDCANILTVLEGRGTLVTGGTLECAQRGCRGEVRGSAISGGSSRELRAGDVIQLEAGTPHQLMLAGDNTLSCLVVRVRGIVEGR
jgi:mannose-6-phosphate isomerase-like protein (cupin superfamily)